MMANDWPTVKFKKKCEKDVMENLDSRNDQNNQKYF